MHLNFLWSKSILNGWEKFDWEECHLPILKWQSAIIVRGRRYVSTNRTQLCLQIPYKFIYPYILYSWFGFFRIYPPPPDFEISQFLGEIKSSWSPNSTDLCFWYLSVDQTRSCKPNSRTCVLVVFLPMVPCRPSLYPVRPNKNTMLPWSRIASPLC